MRIVTRPDFDGIVCAALLYDVESITEPIKWVEPGEIQHGRADIRPGDILANLPYHENCVMWFDHHYTNRVEVPFKGLFKIAPSAAGVIYEYYQGKFDRDYRQLIIDTDKIDSADLTMDEVLHPEKYDVVILSMTISGRSPEDEPYWNQLVQLVRTQEIKDIVQEPDIQDRCRRLIEQNIAYRRHLEQFTRVDENVSITDFRACDIAPKGNRFLVYSMFPDANVNLKIRINENDHEKVIVNAGHSIFNPTCKVNLGKMLSHYEGGGHAGAGSCSFHRRMTDQYLYEMVNILKRNEEI